MNKKNTKYIIIIAVILLLMFAFNEQIFGKNNFIGSFISPPETPTGDNTPGTTPRETEIPCDTMLYYFTQSDRLTPRETKTYTFSIPTATNVYAVIEKTLILTSEVCTGYLDWTLKSGETVIWTEHDTSAIDTTGNGQTINGDSGFWSLTIESHFTCTISYTIRIIVYGCPS